jgi:gluconolactonase
MKESDFKKATAKDRKEYIVRPNDEIPLTTLVEGSDSHLVTGQNMIISFITMKAGSIFELHSHPQEQIMFVVTGYCDEVIDDKVYRVREGDVIRLPPNVPHGAFLRDVDCKAIDIFSPLRSDYVRKFHEQNPDIKIRFI